MGSLLLSILVVGLALGVLLYAGALFLQGYIYTEPSEGLFWQAPAAAAALTLFLGLWTLLVANSSTAAPGDNPYDTLLRSSPKEELTRDPVPEIVAIHKNGQEVTYKLLKQPTGRGEYLDKAAQARGEPHPPAYNPDNVKALRLKHNNQDLVFELRPTDTGANRHFVNPATGYTIVEYDGGPTGRPYLFRWSRLLVNLFLNFFHLALWFLCFWLLLRFQWGHALGLAFALWAMFTLVFLPMLLDSAAEVAQQRRSGQGATAELRTELADQAFPVSLQPTLPAVPRS